MNLVHEEFETLRYRRLQIESPAIYPWGSGVNGGEAEGGGGGCGGQARESTRGGLCPSGGRRRPGALAAERKPSPARRLRSPYSQIASRKRPNVARNTPGLFRNPPIWITIRIFTHTPLNRDLFFAYRPLVWVAVFAGGAKQRRPSARGRRRLRRPRREAPAVLHVEGRARRRSGGLDGRWPPR